MADWDTTFNDHENVSPTHSHQGSNGSGLSNGNKENGIFHRLDSGVSSEDSERELILRGGRELIEESGTEGAYENLALTNGHDKDVTELSMTRSKPQYSNGASGTAKARAAKSPFAPSTIDSVPEEEIDIPKDGNLSTFSVDQMANFFRCMKIDDRIISHLHRKNVDGKRFGRLKDSELEAVGMKTNSVILFFREKSSSAKPKKTSSAWRL